jgi:hypothetical protein
MSAFSTSCFVLSAMDGIIEQLVYIKFCVKLGKSFTEDSETLHAAFEEHSLSMATGFQLHPPFMAG